MADKVLIVDDDSDSLKLISLMLKRHGYDVSTAESGGAALSHVQQNTPNLIILDVMMPDMNGLEVCRRLWSNPDTKDIPIIMFTAKTLIDDKVKGFEAGADDYLTKPTHPAELATRVKAILSRSTGDTNPPVAPDNGAAAVQRSGMTIGVLGAKGGVGTSTVALNLAFALLREGEKPVLCDFRPGSGGISVMLGANTQGMARSLNGSDPAGEVITHPDGLHLLLSTPNPKESQNLAVNVSREIEVIQALRTKANPVICDLGTGITADSLKLMATMDRILFVVSTTPMALQMASLQLKELDQAIGSQKISVIGVNLLPVNVAWHEIENGLNRPVQALLSFAPELAFQAEVNKQPMIKIQDNAMIVGQYRKLAQDLKERIHSIPNR